MILNCPDCGVEITPEEQDWGQVITCQCGQAIQMPEKPKPPALKEKPKFVKRGGITRDITSPQHIPTQNPTTKPCPYCGETILFVAVKCKHCGEMLNGFIEPQSVQTIEKTGKEWKIKKLYGCLAMAIWFSLTLIAFGLSGRQERLAMILFYVASAIGICGAIYYLYAMIMIWWHHE